MLKRFDKSEVFHRTLLLQRAEVDEEARTVPAALSSEMEVKRWFGREVLSHEEGAVDLTRALDGLPLLFNHNHNAPIGIVRGVELVEGKLRGVLHFSENSQAEEIWKDVRGGFLKDISIGYRITEWVENDEDDILRATQWEILEASVVTVPADTDVGINRSQEDLNMDPAKKPAPAAKDQDQRSAGFQQTYDAGATVGKQQGVELERQRVADIEATFARTAYAGDAHQALKRQCIADGSSLESTRSQLLALVGDDAAPVAGKGEAQRAAAPNGEQTDVATFARNAELALCLRAGIKLSEEETQQARSSGMLSMDMMSMAREHVRMTGGSIAGDRREIAGLALSRNHGSSDFPSILANVANKSILRGFEEAMETWRPWARTGSLSDFRSTSRVGLSNFEDLEKVSEGGEYKYGTMSDHGETLQLATYGKVFKITREAIINDDLSMLSSIPMKMGQAAARTVADVAYSALLGAAKLSDNKTLFHTDHKNLASSGGAISVATLDAGKVAMAKQVAPGGKRASGTRAKTLLVPVAQETAAKQLIAAEFDPSQPAARLPNPFNGTLEVVSDVRLDDDSETAWYMLADANQHDTIEVAFLNGNETPYMEQRNGFNSDSVEYKVRIDVAAAALAHQGVYKNPGA